MGHSVSKIYGRSSILNPINWLLISLFLLGISTGVSATGVVSLEPLERVEIQNDRILLGEIARISGEDDELVQRLGGIVIGRAPLAGKSCRIDEGYIRIRMKQSGIDLCQVRMPSSKEKETEVFRSSATVPRERIEAIVVNFLRKEFLRDDTALRVTGIQVNQDVILPKGNMAYEVLPPKNTELLGRVPLSVRFYVNGALERKVWVTANFEKWGEVVVTKRPLGRRHPVTDNDVELQQMDLAGLPSNVITRLEDVLGKRTRRTIDSHVALRTDHVELPPLVRRGDVVVIVAESDGLRITARGVAKERGQRGGTVRVVNLDSNKGIYARVTDANTVTVDF